MTAPLRATKQIIIALIFFLILGGVSFGVYRSFSESIPMPTPDVTIHLSPIQILSTKLLNVANNDYDFVAKVYNPNFEYGSANVEYKIIFYNAVNIEIGQKNNSFYILPGQTRYVINTPLRFQELPVRAEMNIVSIDWQKIDPLGVINISLITRNVTYGQVAETSVFSKAGGNIVNNSDYDLNQVNIIILLFDGNDNIIATNRTEIWTFIARTTRGFETNWYSPFVGVVARVEVEAHTNVLENSNFLRQYDRQERFQQFY